MKPQHAFDPNKAADLLWNSGADTLQIAQMLRLPEHEIYNTMHQWKGAFVPAALPKIAA